MDDNKITNMEAIDERVLKQTAGGALLQSSESSIDSELMGGLERNYGGSLGSLVAMAGCNSQIIEKDKKN